MSAVEFENVWKIYDDCVAAPELNLEIKDGELLVLVGPSGCRKTTTLRMLAGLTPPSHGRILIDKRDVTPLPPGQRDIAMVFQSYALYPHRSVRKNLAFGPHVRGGRKKHVDEQVTRAAALVGLDSMLDRKPGELSGGQRQRVALARSLIREPRLFLLDEPLSNLDASLRVHMRAEIVALQRRLGVTTVYVTHDQVEAMTMGHRIAVFNQGRILQIATPAELYRSPANRFVATFIGSPKMNIVEAEFDGSGEYALVRALGTGFRLSPTILRAGCVPIGPVEMGIRPDDLHWVTDAPSRCTEQVTGVITAIETTGAESFVAVRIAKQEANTRFPSFADVSVGQQVTLVFDSDDVHFFDAATGDSLLKRLSAVEGALVETYNN
jgi:multiple sugar transport system ATP-binding protein